MDYIKNYWGKARPVEDSATDWHPLAYHSLDVAAAMQALLELRPGLWQAVSQNCGLPPEEARRQLVIAAALHDIGKFAENFQCKVPELAHRLGHDPQRTWLTNGHGDVGYSLWEKHHSDTVPDDFTTWMLAALSHHGTPVTQSAPLRSIMTPESEQAAKAFVASVMALLGPLSPQAHAKAGRKSEVWRVAGLIMLADWIGSNVEDGWFPYVSPDYTLADYWPLACQKARKALNHSRLEEAMSATAFDLKTYLGPDADPTPLQQWAQEQTPKAGPHLYIIEDLTGAGKTEAALILAHRLMRSGSAEGLYWALPSMATANGLYERLRSGYRRLFDGEVAPSLVLAHSARDLNTGFQASRHSDKVPDALQSPEDFPAEAHCAAFVAEDRKKTFLAQVGVGTIDQALLAVLPTRHQAVRLAALSRRVLVIDEAHSFDEYMNKGLESLIELHSALGGSTIILSATLTQKLKGRFAKAFGASATDLTADAFPLVTHIDAQKTVTQYPITALRGTRRDLRVRRFDTPETVMDALLERAGDGACGLYVCNTVKDATSACDYLKAQAGNNITVHLFHARFCLADRIARETEILSLLGKHSTAETRRGHLVVATQVVEQSLDLDADHMATDLCPIDLLIQRAGRLHRHARAGRPSPELWVVSPEANEKAAQDWYSACFPNGQYVYPHVGQLWRTLRVVTQAAGLNLASDSPRHLIEPVFGDEDELATPPALEAQSLKALSKAQADRAVAHLNFLKISKGFERGTGAWDSDIRTPTRLGEASLTLRLARWDGAQLTPWAEGDTPRLRWRLSEITLRASQCEQTIAPDEACAQAIANAQKAWPQRYDPPPVLALTPCDGGIWQGRVQDKNGHERQVTYSTLRGLLII